MSDINISGYPQRGKELVEMIAKVVDNPEYFNGDGIPEKIKLTEEQYKSLKNIDGLEEQDEYEEDVPLRDRVCLYFTGEYIMDVEVL